MIDQTKLLPCAGLFINTFKRFDNASRPGDLSNMVIKEFERAVF